MTGLTVIFRTPSQIEADVVRGLLETHGIRTIVSSDMSRTPFPLAVNELRIAVHEEEADRAKRIIASHREESGPGRVVPFGSELEPLERQIGYRFKDRGLLEHALTHRSRVHEDASGGVFDNESMEFLGDSVLGFVIADMLFREFPHHNEGQKSKLKASIVSAASLARLGEKINLGEFLILGRGEEKTGGRRKLALIADCYEALIAAIYIDGGIEPAKTFSSRRRDAPARTRRLPKITSRRCRSGYNPTIEDCRPTAWPVKSDLHTADSSTSRSSSTAYQSRERRGRARKKRPRQQQSWRWID
jgi:Ribonuclease-III-like/Putative prokaryotic signal transducing protein